MKKWKLAILLVALVIALPAACIVFDQVQHMEGNTIVFLEHKYNTRGQLVSGNYTGSVLSGEGYVYDAENSLLEWPGSEYVNGSLKVLVGTTRSLMQDAGDGITTQISGISSLPSTVSGLNVEEVLDDGTVVLRYNGSIIRLAPGERWEKVSSHDLETDSYRVKLVSTDMIRNNGKIPVSAISS